MENKKRDGLFRHENPVEDSTNDWITPKWIIDAFNVWGLKNGYCQDYYFDLDPCSSMTQPWKCARDSYTIVEDGLKSPWYGNIFLNPPYGRETATWIKILAKYKWGGIALVFARVETQLWQEYIFPTADGILFVKGRLTFARPDGTIPKSCSGAPSALIAWGTRNKGALIELCDEGEIPGAFVETQYYTGE